MIVETATNEASVTMTEAEWGEALREGRAGLGDVPEACRTYGICREALWRDDGALEFVPEEHIEWMGAWALRQILGREGKLLKHIPEGLREYGMCDTAVSSEGGALEFVPARFKTRGMCLQAVRTDGRALEFVPEGLREVWLCTISVKRDGSALEFVPEDLREGWLCMEAVKTTPNAFGFVPEHLKTLEVCHWASREGALPMGVPLRYKKLLERILSAPGRLRPGSLPPERLPR